MELYKLDEVKLLETVKTNLGIGGKYHDAKLKNMISEIKEFMLLAGVSEILCNSTRAQGLIAIGVSDIWYYGSGEIKNSDYFNKRLIQLSASSLNSITEYSEVEKNG